MSARSVVFEPSLRVGETVVRPNAAGEELLQDMRDAVLLAARLDPDVSQVVLGTIFSEVRAIRRAANR